MNDISGNYIPPEEDGNITAFDLFCRNVMYRIQELRTQREDEQDEILPTEARRRLVEWHSDCGYGRAF